MFCSSNNKLICSIRITHTCSHSLFTLPHPPLYLVFHHLNPHFLWKPWHLTANCFLASVHLWHLSPNFPSWNTTLHIQVISLLKAFNGSMHPSIGQKLKTLIPYAQLELKSLTWVFEVECYKDLCSRHSLKYYLLVSRLRLSPKKLPFKALWNSVLHLRVL